MDNKNIFNDFCSADDIKNYVNNVVEMRIEDICVFEKQLLFSIMAYVFEHIHPKYQNMATVNKLLQMAYLKDDTGHRIFDFVIISIPKDDIARTNYINVRKKCDEKTYHHIINDIYVNVIK